ncbi:MAG: subclass B1 metallo-beta-lactamase [Kordiimonas sp.]
MKRLSIIFFIVVSSLVHTTILAATTDQRELQTDERDGVHFTKLHDKVWMHTTYATIEGWGTFPSNGLIVLAENTAILVDTAWNNAQTDTILSWARDVLGTPITSAVFTHAHDDKMGGVQSVKNFGASTYAHPLSNKLAPSEGVVPAEFDLIIADDGSATIPKGHPNTNLADLEIFYAGAAHTVDNIVLKVSGTDILFGGCLIRQGGSTSLGNLGDASVPDWPETVRKIVARFPNATMVIPSHGPPAGRELIALTAQLAKKAQTPNGPSGP